MQQQLLFDLPPALAEQPQSEQQEQLERVRGNVRRIILRFLQTVGAGGIFHADDLNRYVSSRAMVAPGSADRIMRDMRKRGEIRYELLNRRRSQYRFEGWGRG